MTGEVDEEEIDVTQSEGEVRVDVTNGRLRWWGRVCGWGADSQVC